MLEAYQAIRRGIHRLALGLHALRAVSTAFTGTFGLTLCGNAFLSVVMFLGVARVPSLTRRKPEPESGRESIIIPPTIGAAIGFITSEPIPLAQRIGIRLARTAQTVINFGRSRCTAPSMAAS